MMEQYFTPSISSVITISAPRILQSTSLLSLLLELGMYFGFVWTRRLDVDAGIDGSRNVLIFYLTALTVCFRIYSVSRLSQDNEEITERMIILGYIKDFVENHANITRPARDNTIHSNAESARLRPEGATGNANYAASSEAANTV